MPAARFLRAFALTAAIGFGGLSALNWSVDPYDQYGPHGLTPLTRTARGTKSLGIARASDAVGGLVLGSSRVLTLSPAELETRTGVGFYNAGVYYGRTEDFLALTRRFQTTHKRAPEELVIGLDIDAFADQIDPDPELIRTTELRREVPECISLADRWQPARELLSWHQTASALKLLYTTARDHQPALEEHFVADGTIVYEGRNRRIQRGDYDWAEAYAYDRGVYVDLYRQYRRLSPMRQNAWRELMSLCEANHVHLTVFLTPIHPGLLTELQAGRSFSTRRGEVTRFVKDTLPSSGEFTDLTDIASFAGDPAQFYDAVHLRAANASRVVNALFGARDAQRYAVQ
jgi:hypothetical protein